MMFFAEKNENILVLYVGVKYSAYKFIVLRYSNAINKNKTFGGHWLTHKALFFYLRMPTGKKLLILRKQIK
jgi:hypothetical protein